MALFNILIVDDEELICRGLKSMIERSNMEEVETVNFTTDPATVQSVVEKYNPHIIITDINMPVITGLDLIRNISEKYSTIKFIVLSGYDDFKYVKEAFKLGTSDYLLKPGSIDELKSILEKTIGEIKKEEIENLNLQDNKNKYIEAILENRLNKVFSSDNYEELNIEDIFSYLNITFPFKYFNVGILSLYSDNDEAKNIENLEYFMKRIGNRIDNNELSVYYFYDIRNDLAFIFNYSDKVNEEKLNQYLQMLMDLLKESMGGNYFAAAADAETDVKGLIKCYQEAAVILDYKLIFDFNQVIKPSNIISNDEIKDNIHLQLEGLKDNIKSHHAITVSEMIDTIFKRENVLKLGIRRFKKIYKKTINIFEDVVNDYEMINFDKDFKEFSSFIQLSDIRIYLKSIAFDIIAFDKARSAEKSTVGIAKKYIDENYYKDLDMAVVSNMVSLSYSHFSKIFKDETGMNFSEYLQKVRMEKAMALLGNPVNKIQEIAPKVGFSNPKHFTRAFKNHFGFSPSEYREGEK